MKINQIERPLENRQVYGYKSDGNTVTAHRWKVFKLDGNLYLTEPKSTKYGETYAHLVLFFPGVKIGLDIGTLIRWQLYQYDIEDVTRRVPFATKDTFREAFTATMENGGFLKNSYIAFVRQYDEEMANKMMRYKIEWEERKERERQAKIAEQNRLEEIERKKHEQAIAEMIKDAENRIISGGRIENKIVDGKPMLLRLFDDHGIKIAPRSRGWVIDKLTEVIQRDNGSSSATFRKSYNGEKISEGFCRAYFELRNCLIAQ